MESIFLSIERLRISEMETEVRSLWCFQTRVEAGRIAEER